MGLANRKVKIVEGLRVDSMKLIVEARKTTVYYRQLAPARSVCSHLVRGGVSVNQPAPGTGSRLVVILYGVVKVPVDQAEGPFAPLTLTRQ